MVICMNTDRMAAINKPYIGSSYGDSLILVLDQYDNGGVSSEEWLNTLLACAAREMYPTSRELADKSQAIHNLTGVLIGKPWQLIKNDSFSIWHYLSYYCVASGQDDPSKQIEATLESVTPLPVKVICLTEDLFHCFEPYSSFYDRGCVFVKPIHLHDVYPAEVLYFKSFNIPEHDINRYALLSDVPVTISKDEDKIAKKPTIIEPQTNKAVEFSLPEDFFKGTASKNCIGVLKPQVIQAGPKKFAELINLLGSQIRDDHYAIIGPFIDSTPENKKNLACLLAGLNVDGEMKTVLWKRHGKNGVQTESLIDYLVKCLYERSDGKYERAFTILGYSKPTKPKDGSSYAEKVRSVVRERIITIYQGYPGIFK